MFIHTPANNTSNYLWSYTVTLSYLIPPNDDVQWIHLKKHSSMDKAVSSSLFPRPDPLGFQAGSLLRKRKEKLLPNTALTTDVV